ncbi:MAG: glycosyltransferase family 4 protein [Blastocatellia bacterium]|nr:glycosyltransferase family 4 protein [Blastocatellia bacterium]
MSTDSDKEAKKSRLWFITELYYPEETSTGYYLTQTAEGLASDFQVKVICGQPTYSSRGLRAAKREVRRNVEIFRAAGTTLDKNVIPLRIINMLTLGVSVFWNAVRRFRHLDTAVVVTTPPSMPFVIAIAALLRGANYVLLIHDNYPEILFAAGQSREASPIATVLSFANRWLYKNAAKIIVVGRDMELLLKKKTDGLDIPIAFIANWAELETVRPAPRAENKLLRELSLKDRLVFLYAGNMGYPNDIETIVEAAKSLRDRRDVHFIFLGAGVKKPLLTEAVQAHRLTNVTVLDPRPRAEQIDFLNACDVALVSLVPKMLGVSMPSRTYNILAAGKPILALVEPGSEVARVIEDDNIGWHLESGNVEKLISTIDEILLRRGELKTMGDRARTAAVTRYSLETALKRYKEELA